MFAVIKMKRKYEPQLINDENSYNSKNLIIVITIISVVLIGFYFITKFVISNQKEEKMISESVIQSDIIIFGQMLNRKEEEYYVLAYNNKSNLKSIYDNYLKMYNQKDGSLKVYKINMNDEFNKKFIANENNITNDINSLTVNDEVLFKIKEGKIDSYKVGSSEISATLKEISK